jgi:hypothetical protein
LAYFKMATFLKKFFLWFLLWEAGQKS